MAARRMRTFMARPPGKETGLPADSGAAGKLMGRSGHRTAWQCAPVKKSLRRRTDDGDRRRFPMKPTVAVSLTLALASSTVAAGVLAATPAQLLSAYSAQAGAAPSAERGRGLFTTTHGREWSCGSCHGDLPNGTGRHAATGKPIAALAP